MQQVRWHFAWLPSRRERIVLVRSQNHSSALCFWEASPLQPCLSPLTRRQILACPRKDNPCCSLLGRRNTFSFLGESERRVDDQRIYKIFIFNCLFLIFKPSAASPWVMVATSWISPSCSNGHLLFWQWILFGNRESILLSSSYIIKIWAVCY